MPKSLLTVPAEPDGWDPVNHYLDHGGGFFFFFGEGDEAILFRFHGEPQEKNLLRPVQREKSFYLQTYYTKVKKCLSVFDYLGEGRSEVNWTKMY